jgi:hypothetical protein
VTKARTDLSVRELHFSEPGLRILIRRQHNPSELATDIVQLQDISRAEQTATGKSVTYATSHMNALSPNSQYAAAKAALEAASLALRKQGVSGLNESYNYSALLRKVR